MKTFPMFLRMTDRRVVIVGGGEQAAQKCRLILKTEAQITLLAPRLEDELQGLADAGRILWDRSPITAAHFAETALVFIATGCPGLDAALHGLAKAAGALVNVVDQPALCDAVTPSIVDRDPVVVAIGTEGTAPVLARQIKTRVEEMLAPRLGDLAALAGRLRPAAARHLAPRARRDLWRWVFSGAPRTLHDSGREREAAAAIKTAITTRDIAPPQPSAVALVGAGPGSRDLITLRGVQRLQEADIIFYDRLIDPGLLELARRDAERVFVGKAPGNHSWTQDHINRVLVAAAQAGQRVVRLKCGDPGIFARGAEEAAALTQAGLSYEIVPGVTAASAAAASTGDFLTERGVNTTLALTTATSADAGHRPDWVGLVETGARVAVYMGVSKLPEICQTLDQAGLLDGTDLRITCKAETPEARSLSCRAVDLPALLERHDIENPAMIFLHRPLAEQGQSTALQHPAPQAICAA